MVFLVQIILTSIAVILSSYLLPGVRVDSYGTAFMVALVLAVANFLIKPVLLLLTLPLTILTFGLFALVVNGIVILIVSSLVPGFHVSGLFPAILFSIVLSILSSILRSLAR